MRPQDIRDVQDIFDSAKKKNKMSSVREIAKFLSVSSSYIWKIKSGNRPPTYRMASILNTYDDSISVSGWRKVSYEKFESAFTNIISMYSDAESIEEDNR